MELTEALSQLERSIYVAPYVVFDVGGNNFRVIGKVEYKFKKVFIVMR